jgi:hypothetical protein
MLYEPEVLPVTIDRTEYLGPVVKVIRALIFPGTATFLKYTMDTHGVWQIRGEDPNCDSAGMHGKPHICYIEGTYEDAIKRAARAKDFFTFGSGGSIELIVVEKVKA